MLDVPCIHDENTLQFAFTQKYYFKELKKEFITMFWKCDMCNKLFIIRRNEDTQKDIFTEVE